ncbi:MAG: polyprenyl diphosphate synthase [Oscillospiraceae bacterium]|nr:polyprenyl diphosphate synthase [Oscillospiraceae bacterium]
MGFIMDGNGRWAAKRGLPRSLGHRAGGDALKRVVEACRKIGIPYVTFYAFSTENWKRPADEVDALMKLFKEYLDEAERFAGQKARIRFLGDKTPFPDALRSRMTELEKNSAQYTSMTIMLAMNYGGRDDIVYAAKRLARLSADGDITPEDIDEKTFSGMLYTGSAPDADLIVRSSGEQRLSNFLLWQSAYAEFYFTDTLWPDFDEKELNKALESYASRSRRFGGV